MTCTAYETLGTLVKRRAFDSVDPLFDDDIPSAGADSKEHFYEEFGPVFQRNSRCDYIFFSPVILMLTNLNLAWDVFKNLSWNSA